MPDVADPPGMLFTSQITAGGPFWTVALNCKDPPAVTLRFAGETVIFAAGNGLIMTLAKPAVVPSACKTAAMVTVTGPVTFAGAV